MGDSGDPASYIHMVQHLIEECIIFKMDREECMEALCKHANIMPAITSTVWKELEKENREFFEAYKERRSGGGGGVEDGGLEMELRRRIQRLLLSHQDSPGDDPEAANGDS